MDTHHDYQGLGRRIASGASLEEAAAALAIPLDAVLAHAKAAMAAGDALPWQLRLIAQRALSTSIGHLEQLAAVRMRSKHAGDVDLRAAEALAKLAISALKLAQPARVVPGRGGDVAAGGVEDRGPWSSLKTPGV